MITIGTNCIGCGKCVKACPFGALSMSGKRAVVSEACTMCGACIPECPVKCISMPAKAAAGPADLSAYKGVWVFMETLEDAGAVKMRGVGYELLSKGRELANTLGEELCAVIIGHGFADNYAEISSYGADKIYAVSETYLKEYNTDAYSQILISLIKKHKPSTVLFPSTYVGRDLAPRISAEIHVGLTADCTGLSINAERNLVQTRPAFGGNIMADILTPNHRPQMATVRPNVMKKNITAPGAKANVINEVVSLNPKINRVKILKKHIEETGAADKLDAARVVVSGGRGVKTAEGFAMLGALAQKLGGAVGASRAAVDLGLKPKDRQVGQSGVTVSPKLYVACGISGAVQHVVGMENSDTIIAINKDPRAPIFNICKIGLVGDVNQILPRVIEELNSGGK